MKRLRDSVGCACLGFKYVVVLWNVINQLTHFFMVMRKKKN